MKKEKIYAIRNLTDSIWYTFCSNDNTLDYLNEIFGIYEKIEDFELNRSTNKVNSLTKERDYCLFIEKKEAIVYLIITQKAIHLIIRKTGKFSLLIGTLNKHFE